MGAGPKYPNQQLQSVSLETFFAGTLGGFTAMAKIQDALRAKLPDLYVPNVLPGEALMLRPFQLRDRGMTRSLALALNQVTFFVFRYPGYEDFVGEALPILSMCLKELGVSDLTRVIYRYENALSLAREDQGTLGALTRAFPRLAPTLFEGRAFRQLESSAEVVFSEKLDGTDVHGGEGFRVQVEPGPIEVLRLHVHAMIEHTKVASLASMAALAHTHAVAMFESVISEEFRGFLKGDHARISDPG